MNEEQPAASAETTTQRRTRRTDLELARDDAQAIADRLTSLLEASAERAYSQAELDAAVEKARKAGRAEALAEIKAAMPQK